LGIWQKVAVKHPDWTLDIYGKSVTNLRQVVLELGMESNVNLNEPVNNISEK